jgi:1-acyl-sn-glycerol-3-phosphate acyltransferase
MNKRAGFFRKFFAAVRFAAFWLAVILQVPMIIVIPRGKYSVKYFSTFMRILMGITGVRVRADRPLVSDRPLLVVSNHISVFEFGTFPTVFGGSFFGKDDIAKMPLVGWIAKKFGVIFINRDKASACAGAEKVRETIESVSYPMFLFPEGTSTSGTVVHPFKSSLFNFFEMGVDAAVQPIVMTYRYRDGSKIPDQILVDDFSYTDNRLLLPHELKMSDRDVSRSAFGQVYHIMALGGFLVEITVLPPVPVKGLNRKEIAETLYKIISDKYMELK